MTKTSCQILSKCLLSLLVCSLLLPGCRKPQAHNSTRSTGGQQLLIGLIPEQNIFRQMERYEPIASYLSNKTGMKVRLTILPRYGNIIDNFTEEKMDGAFFGSFTYALAHAKLGVEVIARPEALDGTSTYHGYIFVRKDSGIAEVGQMSGKRFAFVDKATTAGYLLPLAYFKKHRVDHRAVLREAYYSGTHEDTIYDVLMRKADIGAAKNTVYERLADNDERIRRELKVIEHSPAVPENAIALRRDIDHAVKTSLTQALLMMHNDPEGKAVLRAFGAAKFIRTDDIDYQPVYQYAREIGLNLRSYDYKNE